MNEAEIEILTCPFCGKKPKQGEVSKLFYISCRDNSCINPMTGSFQKREAALAAWNTRAGGWQPIESAPKDGREILVSSMTGLIYHVSFRASENKWRCANTGIVNRLDFVMWHPIPEPPALKAAKGGTL